MRILKFVPRTGAFLTLSALLLGMVCLSGCGNASSSAPGSEALGAGASFVPPSSSGSGTTGVGGMTGAGQDGGAAEPMGQPLFEALSPLVAYETGEAGTSLKSEIAACSLLDWAGTLGTTALQTDPDGTALVGELESWYSGLDERSREAFAANWPDVNAAAERILADPEGQRDALESAGILTDYSDYKADDYKGIQTALQSIFRTETGNAA